jgi:hypothetical protein
VTTTNKRSVHPATMVVNHEISKFKAADNYKRRYIALLKKSEIEVSTPVCR